MKSLRGQLLISNGGLFDPNFRHTVVLIGAHSDDGAVGVVLNRSLDATVESAIPALSALVPPGEPLYQGGPVEPANPVLLAELTDPDLADILIFGSIGFLVGEVSAQLRPNILRARIFVGHSGWGPGQLEAELEANSWILEPAHEEDVFSTEPDLLWRHVLQRKGPAYEWLSRMPYDPSTN